MPLELVERHDWHAEPAKSWEYLSHPVEHVVVWYNTDIQECDTDESCIRAMMELQRRDLAEGLEDIKYNFVIGGNGKTYIGRGWNLRSSDKLPYAEFHANRIDVAYIGNFRGKTVLPFSMHAQQLDLVEYGVENNLLLKYYSIVEEERKFL